MDGWLIVAIIVIGILAATVVLYEKDAWQHDGHVKALMACCRVYETQQADLVKRLNDALFTWDFPEAPSDNRIEQLLSSTPGQREVYASWRPLYTTLDLQTGERYPVYEWDV